MLQDDNSGRQRWVFTATAGGFTISVAGGRAGCSTLLTAGTTCGNDNSVTLAAMVSVLAAEAKLAWSKGSSCCGSLMLMQAQVMLSEMFWSWSAGLCTHNMAGDVCWYCDHPSTNHNGRASNNHCRTHHHRDALNHLSSANCPAEWPVPHHQRWQVSLLQHLREQSSSGKLCWHASAWS